MRFDSFLRRHLVLLAALFSLAGCGGERETPAEAIAARGFASGDGGTPDARSTMLEVERPPSPLPAGCVDADGDRWPVCSGETPFSQDCDDDDSSVFPHAAPACDGSDRNCNGVADTEEPGGCRPADPANNRPAEHQVEPDRERPPPTPWPAGCADLDDDRWPACPGTTEFSQDCDDSDPRAFPYASPACDGSDSNCNGIADTEEPGGCRPADPANNRPSPDAGP